MRCDTIPAVTTWSIRTRGDVVEIGYGSGTSFPQYAALHLDSGYFRLNYGPGSDWGTSIIIVPSLWIGGVYYQGTAIVAEATLDGGDLVIDYSGTIAGLSFEGRLRLHPPGTQSITADVSVTTSGTVSLDARPGEAFKPVMLSSMRISASVWDTSLAQAGSSDHAIPGSGWIIQPPASAREFALIGGTSSWKTNAPTIEIELPTPLSITGWVTPSADPNDDNVGFWAASSNVLSSWSYTITARP